VENSKFNQERYSLLVYDGHSTHTCHLEALKLLNKNKIIAVCSPSHSSHLFNIGDITVFSKFKQSWKRNLTEYQREGNKTITLKGFPFIFKRVWDQSLNQSAIISGKSTFTFLFI